MFIPETVKTYGLIILIIGASFWFASRFIEPPPPNELTMAAGSANGEYYRYATIYKSALEKDGVTVNILETAGSAENARLLSEGKADIAFIQSGSLKKSNQGKIETLSSLYYEPLWVFTRDVHKAKKDLQNTLSGTLAVGEDGSGTMAISVKLLDVYGTSDQITFSNLSGEKAADALVKGDVDAAFFIARPDTPYIQELLNQEDIHLLSFDRAEAYTRRFPFLSEVKLSEGVMDIVKNTPSRDIHLISPVAQLTVREDFNGALKTLMVRSAIAIHGEADIFSDKGHFPSLDYADFPLAEEAERYFKYGPNILQRIMPFWLADMINRMVVMLIPLVGVMFPLLKIASPTYRWRTRSRIYRWYKSLKKMEESASTGDVDVNETLKSLASIDAEVKKTIVPLSYSDELYNLRLHIQLIKGHLEKNKS
jgi:TRAP-type uncharacterized transport system substrate-binding protein